MSRRPIIRLLSSRLARPARLYHHKMPTLEQEHQFQNGIPGFLSRGALQMAWYEKQMDLLIRLNQKVSGMFDQTRTQLRAANLPCFCQELLWKPRTSRP